MEQGMGLPGMKFVSSVLLLAVFPCDPTLPAHLIFL